MLFRPRARRAIAILFAFIVLASVQPARASYAPKFSWSPNGPVTYGDPDPGGGGIDMFRLVPRVLLLSVAGIANPFGFALTPIDLSSGARLQR